MKWILLSLVLGGPLYLSLAENDKETPLCTYFSNTRFYPHDKTETEIPCLNCHSQTVKVETPSIENLLSSIKEVVEKKPCCFVYYPKGVQPKDRLKDGKLSFYWAQELIGADLLRKDLEKKDQSQLPKNFIAVFDTDADGNECAVHTEQVESIISNQRQHAVLPQIGDRMKFNPTVEPKDYRNSSIGMSNDVYHFINNSMSWKEDPIIYNAFADLTPSSIVIISSGNDYPKPLQPLKIKTSRELNTILVGSLSSDGLVSDFSQQGSEVYILAPAGRELTSANDEGAYCKFGGTSGAAPLVTASLAGFEWLSGYHPTPEEAKNLLKKTAIPTIHSAFEKPKRNGHGILNTYKLGWLTKKLKKLCRKKSKEEKILCFKQAIRDDNTYRVSLKEDIVYGHINKAFPECNDKENPSDVPHITTCEEKQKALEVLRKSVLLNPERAHLWKVLSCIYRNNGFTQNAQLLDRIRAGILRDENIFNQFFTGSIEERRKWVRLVSNVGGVQNEEKLTQLVHSESTHFIVKKEVAQSVVSLKESYGVEKVLGFLKVLAQDTSSEVRKQTAISAGLLEGPESEKIIQSLFEDEDSHVRQAAYRVAIQKRMSDGIRRLQDLIQSGEDTDLIQRLVDWIKETKIKGGEEVLNMINSKNPN